MRGVYNPWASVHDAVITEVKSLVAKYPDYTLESAGHSLGGSLTYVSYVALAQNFPGKAITSNALAAFPIGNAAWASFASSQSGTLNRGNNAGDGVPVSLNQVWVDWILFSNGVYLEHVCPVTIQLQALWHCKSSSLLHFSQVEITLLMSSFSYYRSITARVLRLHVSSVQASVTLLALLEMACTVLLLGTSRALELLWALLDAGYEVGTYKIWCKVLGDISECIGTKPQVIIEACYFSRGRESTRLWT
jgi:hypothetical protein